jgi:cytidylate kinase
LESYPNTNVNICGLTAAGKSTHAHLLAGRFGMQYVSASQVLLNSLGMSPVQPRDHWVTDHSRSDWSRENYRRVDEELLAIEKRCQLAVFDTLTMPWLHTEAGFSIWLESSLESRVMKAAVSHRAAWPSARKQLAMLVARKDAEQAAMLMSLYGFFPELDPGHFDLVLDVTEAIDAPSWEASLESIRRVDAILSAAVGWGLTQSGAYKREFLLAVRSSPQVIVMRCPEALELKDDS